MDLGVESNNNLEEIKILKIIKPNIRQNVKVTYYSEIKKSDYGQNFLLSKQDFLSCNNTPSDFSKKMVTYIKYFESNKSYFFVKDYINMYLLEKENKPPRFMGTSQLKSRIMTCQFLFEDCLLLGHLNGFLSVYSIEPNFANIRFKKHLIIYKIFPLSIISFNETSNLILLASYESSRLSLFEFDRANKDISFKYIFQRTDFGLYRANIFFENPWEKKFPTVIVASTVSKLHVFNINKREDHDFFLVMEPLVSLEKLREEKVFLGCSSSNKVYFYSMETKDLVKVIDNDHIDPIFFLQSKSLCHENYWFKLFISNVFKSEIKIEIWDKADKMSSFVLPDPIFTKGKLEMNNNKEVIQIFYVNYLDDKNFPGQYIVTSGDDFLIRIYKLEDLSLFRSWQASNLPITSIVIIPSDQGLLVGSCSFNNIIQIWDFFKGDVPVQSLNAHTLDVNVLLFIDREESIAGSAKYLVSGSSDKSIILWVYDQNYLFVKKSQVKACETSVISLEYIKVLGVQQWVAAGNRDKTIKLYSLPKLTCLRELVGHKDSVKCLLTFYRPKEFLSLFYNENLIKTSFTQNIYCNNNQIIRPSETPYLMPNIESYPNIFFSPDMEVFLISGSMDKSIKIWDIFSGACLYTLYGHQGYINSLIWLQDNNEICNRLASASQDGSIKIWDMINLVCLNTMHVDFPRFSSGLCYIKEDNILVHTNYRGEITFQRIFVDFDMQFYKRKILWRMVGNVKSIENKVNNEKKCIIF